ncbi:hypothetical protein [Actinoplanes siamensis]|uniref:Uncharacterized protein n=1 Tax=Actinoplanes siamensis TaxID=1223317 RepID=A0A919TNI3_9ACTN|nr:hypothetical protein [Actinoplanes siamensis]GIF09531.1 hypothetical protein Asi03nite_70690 [Actinoplanes siamensis]
MEPAEARCARVEASPQLSDGRFRNDAPTSPSLSLAALPPVAAA